MVARPVPEPLGTTCQEAGWMDLLSSEHGPGTDSPIPMCEGDVHSGPLKNDVSISMLILGRAEKKRVFPKSRWATTAPRSTPRGAGALPGEGGAGLGAAVGGRT